MNSANEPNSKPDRKAGEGKPYDLEERTELFAKQVCAFVRRLPRTISNIET